MYLVSFYTMFHRHTQPYCEPFGHLGHIVLFYYDCGLGKKTAKCVSSLIVFSSIWLFFKYFNISLLISILIHWILFCWKFRWKTITIRIYLLYVVEVNGLRFWKCLMLIGLLCGPYIYASFICVGLNTVQ